MLAVSPKALGLPILENVSFRVFHQLGARCADRPWRHPLGFPKGDGQHVSRASQMAELLRVNGRDFFNQVNLCIKWPPRPSPSLARSSSSF